MKLHHRYANYCYLTPRQLAQLWVNIRRYICEGKGNVNMFKNSFGNGAYYKEGALCEDFSGTVYHIAGIQGDVVYAIMSRYTERHPIVNELRTALIAATK